MMNDDEDTINVESITMHSDIKKILVRFRHINKKVLKCYIHYKLDSIGCSGILRHTCDSANGFRSVGCCSHVAAVKYYFSRARYKCRLIRPAKVISDLLESEDIEPVIDEQSDEG